MRSGAPKGTDTVYAIEAANPELADVIKTLKTTYAVLGGAYDDSTKDLDLATFDGRRTFILAELHRVREQGEQRQSPHLPHEACSLILIGVLRPAKLARLRGGVLARQRLAFHCTLPPPARLSLRCSVTRR